MSRQNKWVKFLPPTDQDYIALKPYQDRYYKLLREVEQAWYYKFLPVAVKELHQAMRALRERTITFYRNDNLRYKYAVSQSQLKTYKENAAKAREIKQKYNEFRRERHSNAKVQKPE